MTEREKIRLLQAAQMLALSQQVIEDMKVVHFNLAKALNTHNLDEVSKVLRGYQDFFIGINAAHKKQQTPIHWSGYIERTLMFWNNQSEDPPYENELRQYYNKTGEVLHRYIS